VVGVHRLFLRACDIVLVGVSLCDVGYGRWIIAVFEGLRVACLEVLSLLEDGEE